MAKGKWIQVRITDTLKDRYTRALAVKSEEMGTEYSQTDHLTAEIIKFVQAMEKQQQKIAEPSSK